MEKLNRKDLWVLEEYADARATFQPRVLAHRLERELSLGPDLTLCFHDRLTIQYDLQETLYQLRVFERDRVQHELAVRNRLIPDGDNWKATWTATSAAWRHEHGDAEHRIWVQVEGEPRRFAESDHAGTVDLLCFPLTGSMRRALMAGAYLSAGVEHPRYTHQVEVP